MKRIFWYRKTTKTIGYLLQGLLAGLVVLCALAIVKQTDGSFDIAEIGRSFDDTEAFFFTLDEIIHKKITADKNRELFEEGGDYEPEKLVDIRQYTAGSFSKASQNPATSYALGDLISFGQDGAEEMQRKSAQVQEKSEDDAGAADELYQYARSLEKILPSTGIYLSEYSRMSSVPASALMEYYRLLSETAIDIAARYKEYSTYGEAEAQENSDEAPSNILYYVENTSTRQRYTNMGVRTMSAAQSKVAETENMAYVFEGERSFNIMVPAGERVMSDEASAWFAKRPMVGSNERILIAVDFDYTVSDALQSAYLRYEQRQPWLRAASATIGISLLLLLALLIISGVTAGQTERGGAVNLNWFDTIPTELGAGICFIVIILWGLMALYLVRRWGSVLPEMGSLSNRTIRLYILLPLAAALEYWIMLQSLLSFIRRSKRRTLWKNSVVYYVIRGSQMLLSGRKGFRRTLVLFLVFFALNLLFLMVGGLAGRTMMLTWNMAALLYLMREEVGNKTIHEGLKQFQAGKIDYRINTDVLTGESKDLGQAVNEMGDGLQKAVDTMLQNERLRAELITNVSHDLKTPLTSIINYVDLLKKEEPGSEKSMQYRDILEQKAYHLKHLTEDLIELSKITSGAIDLHPVRLTLQDFVQQAIGECEDRLLEAGLSLDLKMETQPLQIEADGEQLWRVFENLIGNIAKYAKKDTRVIARLKLQDEWGVVSFENEPGTPIHATAEELEERFQRGDQSRSTPGSGLGLSIAKNLTQLMGGCFDLEVEENKFLVTVSFPVAERISEKNMKNAPKTLT